MCQGKGKYKASSVCSPGLCSLPASLQSHFVLGLESPRLLPSFSPIYSGPGLCHQTDFSKMGWPWPPKRQTWLFPIFPLVSQLSCSFKGHGVSDLRVNGQCVRAETPQFWASVWAVNLSSLPMFAPPGLPCDFG